METAEWEQRDKGEDKIFEDILVKIAPDLIKDMNLHIQKAQQTPHKINTRRFTSTYTTNKLLKYKSLKRTLKTRGNDLPHKKDL